MTIKVKNIVYRLHEQRERLAPSIEMRRRFLAKAFASQVQVEKDMIASHINKLQPGVRRALLAGRLEQLNAMR